MKCQFPLYVVLLSAIAFSTTDAGGAPPKSADPPQAVMPRQHATVFKKYCFHCHDTDTQEGGVNLADISFDIAKDIPNAELWQKILDAMNSKEMPPEDEEQVPAAQKTAFLDALSNQMVTARRILSDNGGTITLRRLNRREYQNTIEVLLGVRPDVSSFPDDQAASGFDTAGASLFFSSDQLEQYLAVARESLQLSIANTKSRRPKTTRVEPEEDATKLYSGLADEYRDNIRRGTAFKAQSEKPASEFGFLDEYSAKKSVRNSKNWLPQLDEYLQRPETKHGATMILTIKKAGMHRIKLPTIFEQAGGRYVVRVRAGSYSDAMDRMHYLELTSRAPGGAGVKRLGWRKITASIDDPETIEFSFIHPPGTRSLYFVHQRTHQDRGDKNLWTLHQEQNGMGTLPGTWVDWAEIEGPFPDSHPEDVAAGIFFAKPRGMNELRYAKEVISRFANRAFRSEVPSQEFLDKLFAHYQANRANGASEQDALIGPLSIVLSSPSFLYMVEGDQVANSQGVSEAGRVSQSSLSSISQSQLAVRLSYLLWSEPPDDELRAIAEDGKLTDPVVLREQTDRLLADERSIRFVEGFAHQWLQMERLEMFEFRGTLFPNFDNASRESAREEIYETIRLMLRERLPLKNLLHSDFVVINDVLADYYGLNDQFAQSGDAKAAGHEFRKVSLPDNSPRGGLLGTAAVLAMGSDGLRSSPVERGAWVLRHLLNNPPPPAPPNVPQLARLDGEVLGARELQRAHMEEPQCAQCHRKIDPIGYGLEHFNAAGEWRDKELVLTGKKRQNDKLFEINSEGALSSGEKFENYFELREAVARHQDDFARGFTQELISYGLSRPYGFTDQNLVDEIISKVKSGDGAPSQFIHELVQSETFRSKSGGRVAKSNELRVWTDTKGRSIEASLLAVKANVATIRRKDGRVFKIRVDTLSEADRNYLSNEKNNE